MPFAKRMARTRRVILYDCRGRGDSVAVTSSAALDAEVDDLAAIVAHAGPGAQPFSVIVSVAPVRWPMLLAVDLPVR